MANTELLENKFKGMGDPFMKIASIAVKCLSVDRAKFGGYRTKIASSNLDDKRDALTNVYLDSFFDVFNKTASDTQEYIAASQLGEIFGKTITSNLAKHI